jgi:hypothetical protein
MTALRAAAAALNGRVPGSNKLVRTGCVVSHLGT